MAGVTNAVGNLGPIKGLSGSGKAGQFAAGGLANLAGGLAGAAARTVITGTDFGDNVLDVLPSVIGMTVGNMIAGQVAARTSTYKSDLGEVRLNVDPRKVFGDYSLDVGLNLDQGFGSTITGGAAGSYGSGVGLGSSSQTPVWDGYTQGGQRLTLNTETNTSLGLAYTGTFDGQSGNFLKQGSDYLLLDHPGAVDGSVEELVVTASRRPAQPFGMYASNISRSSSRSSSPATLTAGDNGAFGPFGLGSNFGYRKSEARAAWVSADRFFDQRSVLNSPGQNFKLGLQGIGAKAMAAAGPGLTWPISGALDTLGGFGDGRIGQVSSARRETTDQTIVLGGLAAAVFNPALGVRSVGSGLISDVRAISAADVNAPFLAKGWEAPYSSGSQARMFATSTDLDFVRVTTNNPEGAFLVRAKEIAGMTPEQIQVHLALPKVPTNILNVNVPAGTRMQTGFVAPQPSFGVTTRGGIQYQILDQIPSQSFGPMRPIQ